MNKRPRTRGRGSSQAPDDRFEAVQQELDYEQIENDPDFLESLRRVQTQYLFDDSQSVVSENDNSDIPFRFSLNPYRGCLHGCSYCYARPTHEYLGMNSGIDFKSKVVVKRRAPELFYKFLGKSSWQPELIVLSGVTDPYQPAEREFKLTRACLEVALESRQPLSIITTNALVTRDLDLLRELASQRKDRSANGTSASVCRVGRIMRSSIWDRSGWMRPDRGGAEELPAHSQGRMFLVGADRP